MESQNKKKILKPTIQRGQIWLFDPNPIIGNEIGIKLRPAIIISNNIFNNSLAGLVIIIPLTSKRKKIPCHITITSKDAPLDRTSFAMCDQIRTISKQRLIKCFGKIHNNEILQNISEWLADLLEINNLPY